MDSTPTPEFEGDAPPETLMEEVSESETVEMDQQNIHETETDLEQDQSEDGSIFGNSFSDTEESMLSSYSALELTHVDFKHWDNENNIAKFRLWKTDTNFWDSSKPYTLVAEKFGRECVLTCHRAHHRKPTVDEFWNLFMSKKVPRQSWFASWKVINPERRGWPFQYILRAKVLVLEVQFTSSLSTPNVEVEIIETAHDDKYRVGQRLKVNLCQLEPDSPGPDFFTDGISIEDAKAALQLTRDFYDLYYFCFDVRDFVAFFENILYDRLELIYYLDRPSPSSGVLSNKDRGKIIAGLKHYHYLRNSLDDVMVESSREGVVNEIEMQELQSGYFALQMQLDRHRVELRFLLNKTMRSLLGGIENIRYSSDEDCSVSSYDAVLVMKTIRVDQMEKVISTINLFTVENPVSNLRVMTDLETTLKNCNARSTIFVVSGDYSISGLGRLGAGGSIIGIPNDDGDVTLLPTDDIGDMWLVVDSKSTETPLTLKNVSIIIDEDIETTLDSCIYIASGHLIMNDTIVRKRSRLTHPDQGTGPHAIQKAENTTVHLSDCKFENFSDEM